METKTSFKDMAATTLRRSSRLPHTYTPKLSDRKKGLFQSVSEPPKESLTKHRKLLAFDSESDSEDCDIGIISTLDSSSDENDHDTPRTPERNLCYKTRSQTRRYLRENNDLKNFIKSPFTLKKFQNRCSYPDSRCTGSVSTPGTPHIQTHPGTPSSTHSCTSIHTNSSTSSRARKSLASLIADTESCSSSLKDLNFDSDSGTDSKANTPTKSIRCSNKTLKQTPKFHNKEINLEHKKNMSRIALGVPLMKNAVVCLTKMDMSSFMSPTQIQKTPQNTTEAVSPPKIGHRRSGIEIAESPESTCNSEKSCKRLRNEINTESGPSSKYPCLENAPKARLSLFNSERLEEIISTKAFYSKTNPKVNTNVTAKISNAIKVSTTQRKPFHAQTNKRKRIPTQINLGVSHKILKPKHKIVKNNSGKVTPSNSTMNSTMNSMINSTMNSTMSTATNNASMISQTSLQKLQNDYYDNPQLLSQWEEREIPKSELNYSKPKDLSCVSSAVIEETKQIFQPIIAVHVTSPSVPRDNEAVIVDLGGNTSQVADELTITCRNGMTITQNESAQTQNGNIAPMKDELQDVVMADVERHEANGEQSLPVDGGAYMILEEEKVNNYYDNPQLLSQWEEREIPKSELNYSKPKDLSCVSSAVIEETKQIFQPIIAVHVTSPSVPRDNEAVIVDLGGNTSQVADELTITCRNGMTITQNESAQTQNGNIAQMKDELQDVVMADVERHEANGEQSLPVDGGAYMILEEEKVNNTEKANDVSEKPQLFQIFRKPNPGVHTPTCKGLKSTKKFLKAGTNQYIIDAGQKKFGATQCANCETIYQIGDPQDEHDHLVYHNAMDILRFNGWKNECVVEHSESSRCIRVRGGEQNWRRVELLLKRVVDPLLGCEGQLSKSDARRMTAYLCIAKKQVIGCLVVEPKTKAYKLIPGDPDCCSVEDFPVKCGISRIWTHINHRRRGVARRLLDCARASFYRGVALRIEDIAFSAPTAAGKAFASRYTGRNNFYVYLY